MADSDTNVKPFEKKHFTFDNILDLTGKVAVVTGGNAWIGYITSENWAKKMHIAFSLTDDGIQEEFGLFTKLLLPKIKASQPARIVNLSSLAHRFVPVGGIEFEKLNDPMHLIQCLVMLNQKTCKYFIYQRIE
ncbi:3218_t:CDS:2 [Racocetra persica]|uniref:3218_t:CDS:1 n=1 Tax=Racocetra persica TaxID=160502 RepID=A0ACA9MIL8_9GLOM|nr:3218_t:CDS:2 [Racocetra persica]